MIQIKRLILTTIVFTTVVAYAQSKKSSKRSVDTLNITFKDTVSNIAFDSINNNLGTIVPNNNRLVKHFKYIGTDSISITNTWTSDPHFICEYPKGPLIPNKIYSLTVCFWHQDKQGPMNKTMGFYLSDGTRIALTFSGTYLPIITDNK